MEAAVDAIKKNRLNLNKAAEVPKVPKSTLFDQVRGKRGKIGAGKYPTLSPQEEEELVSALELLADWGWGQDRSDVTEIIKNS